MAYHPEADSDDPRIGGVVYSDQGDDDGSVVAQIRDALRRYRAPARTEARAPPMVQNGATYGDVESVRVARSEPAAYIMALIRRA